MNNNLKVVLGTVAGIMIGGLTVVGANQAIQAMQNTEIKISLNGQIQEFKDETTGEVQYPITYHNRTYLPLRNVAQLSGLNVAYDEKTNTAKLDSNIVSINEIDVSQAGERTAEYKEDLKNKMSNIKNALVGAGEFKLQSAHTSKNKDEYMEYWGSSYRNGGGLKFNNDDTFLFTIGSYADNFDRGGRYVIDMNNEQIIYVFYNGTVEYGKYGYSNGKIDKVTYVDASFYSEESDKLIVDLIANSNNTF